MNGLRCRFVVAESLLRREIFGLTRSVAVRFFTTDATKESNDDQNREQKDDIAEGIRAFKSLGLCAPILAGLYKCGISQPTRIQNLAIPTLLNGRNAVIAAETGSGKTLAYTLPILHNLCETANQTPRRPYRPRALIVVPNLYLCQQAFAEAKRISAFTNLTIGTAFGRRNDSSIDTIDIPTADILFGTTSKVLRLHEKGKLYFSDLRYVVVDEAEFQTSDGYEEELGRITRVLKLANEDREKKIQIVCATATLVGKLTNFVNQSFTDVETIKSEMLHRPVPTLKQRFVSVLANGKHDELIFWMEKFKTKKTIVFCNTVPSAQSTCYFLEEQQFPTIGLYGEMPMKV
eukprot:TRINITY_DN10878_c0_g1_i3.p1 TRINITY_DN10878_c0_g1~~TRINITY_DN10878_c0_g1_i3.p1  ORF type:complete len:347 (-),score=75.06 TRINITY_DN10878_c0_g1_i3:180-1220(-)